ncbi:MAG: hypothetical protein ACI8W8_004040 [Rhodothermales bacterium]|jgi:hypothetical protein
MSPQEKFTHRRFVSLFTAHQSAIHACVRRLVPRRVGIATGYAAVVCKKHGVTPREVGKSHIRELRTLIGFESA